MFIFLTLLSNLANTNQNRGHHKILPKHRKKRKTQQTEEAKGIQSCSNFITDSRTRTNTVTKHFNEFIKRRTLIDTAQCKFINKKKPSEFSFKFSCMRFLF